MNWLNSYALIWQLA